MLGKITNIGGVFFFGMKVKMGVLYLEMSILPSVFMIIGSIINDL